MDNIIVNHQQILYIILDYYYEPEYYQDIIYLYLSCKFFRDYVKENRVRFDCIFYKPKTNVELEILVCKWCENKLDIIGKTKHISKWNTINITDMRCLFAYKEYFNDDISMWITYNVKTMYGMFAGANMFNIDISKWDTRNVEDMSYMFWRNDGFNKSINNWNLDNIIYIDKVFTKSKLKKINPQIIRKCWIIYIYYNINTLFIFVSFIIIYILFILYS